MKVVRVVDAGECQHVVLDWDESDVRWAKIRRRDLEAYKKWPIFLHPVKIVELPEFDYPAMSSHIAVRTDVYPLWWMWAGFIEKARQIARNDFYSFMCLALALGLVKPRIGHYPSVDELIFWPSKERIANLLCLSLGIVAVCDRLAKSIDGELSVACFHRSSLKAIKQWDEESIFEKKNPTESIQIALRKGGVNSYCYLSFDNGWVDWVLTEKTIRTGKSKLDRVLRDR